MTLELPLLSDCRHILQLPVHFGDLSLQFVKPTQLFTFEPSKLVFPDKYWNVHQDQFQNFQTFLSFGILTTLHHWIGLKLRSSLSLLCYN